MLPDKTPSFFVEGVANAVITFAFSAGFWLVHPVLLYYGIDERHGWGVACACIALMMLLLVERFERARVWLRGMQFKLEWAVALLYGSPAAIFVTAAYLTLSWVDNDALAYTWIAGLFVPAFSGLALAWHVHAVRVRRLERLSGRP